MDDVSDRWEKALLEGREGAGYAEAVFPAEEEDDDRHSRSEG